MTIRVAAAAWKLKLARKVNSDGAYFNHAHQLVSQAHEQGAQIVVLPELHVLELLHIVPELKEMNVAKYLVQYADAIEEWVARISELSGMVIVGGSHFKETPEGIKNVCAIGVPGHGVTLAEKNNLTGYEKRMWGLAKGKGLVQLPRHRLGVAICYDSEFPAGPRALAEAGAQILAVPSWTETQRGFQRVRWSSLARALENTCFAVHASLVGDLGVEPVPETYGSSAILAPSVSPFPMNAILAETPMNEEGVVVADLDLDQLEEARRDVEVTNWADRDAGDWTVRNFADEDRAPNQGGQLN
ncbi:MAG: nitrilase-related carbon-nitrogen hydrolase [Fimbriimonas sp.]